MKTQSVILVTEDDVPIGTMEKMEAHMKGVLHRAFSVFIFNGEGKMLLQQRAAEKYHGAHLWTNACCSHPYPGEPVAEAAVRRLEEELGFTTTLTKLFHFTYKSAVENDLIEHEFDHVFGGEYESEIKLNKEEVAAYRYLSIDEIKKELNEKPQTYTTWFRIAFPTIEHWWEKQYGTKVGMK
jgi:isopentenyl-diphosphate Delta-isomerase